MYKINEYLANLMRIPPRQGRRDFLRLDMNENPEGLPKPFFSQVLKKITPELLASYPETGILTAKIAKYTAVNENSVALFNGSDEAIKTIFEIFGTNDIVSVYPTFEMYAVYAKMYGLNHKIIEYNSDFTLDFSKLLNAIDNNTAIVSLLNPNNPIGNVYTNIEIQEIIKKAQIHGAIIVIDEAYHYFYRKSFLEFAVKYDNVIILRTFSKLCSLAGCRLGYVVAHEKIVSLLNKVRGTYCINTFAIEFALALLNSPDLIESLISTEKKGREFILTELKKQNYFCYAENGNYIFIKPRLPVEKIYLLLEKEKILVKKYTHPVLRDYIRITTGSIHIMQKFLDIFFQCDKETGLT